MTKTGLSIDSEGRLQADEAVWAELIHHNADVKRFKGKALPYKEDLDYIFGGTAADGLASQQLNDPSMTQWDDVDTSENLVEETPIEPRDDGEIIFEDDSSTMGSNMKDNTPTSDLLVNYIANGESVMVQGSSRKRALSPSTSSSSSVVD